MKVELSNKILYSTSVESSVNILRTHWNCTYDFLKGYSFFDGKFSPKNEEYLKAIDLIAKGFAIIDVSQNSKTPITIKKQLINNIENKL